MNQSMLQFIKDIIYDTLFINFNFITPPYENIWCVDRNLRNSLNDSEKLYDHFKDFINALEPGYYYYIKDNMKINYIIFFPYKASREFISLGPFFTEKPNGDYFQQITELNSLSMQEVQIIKGFLFGLPVIENNFQLISTITHVHSYFNPNSETFSVKHVNLDNSDNEEYKMIPKEDFEVYENAICRRYKCESDLLGYIAKGNYEMASYEGRKFVIYPTEPKLKTHLSDIKSNMLAGNTLFRKTVESSKVHPFYLHEISRKYAYKIEVCTSEKELNNLYDKMIREYCTLVRTKSMNQYSPAIRKVLNYIDFNLNLPLTLETLADKYELSIPYLSTLFKKEVGLTIISYINKQRIETACKLLSSTNMSIQDISATVGILDSNYFTRLFKKETGYSPRKYRQTKNLQIK